MRIADAAATIVFCLVSLNVASGTQHGPAHLGHIPPPEALLIPSPASSDTQVHGEPTPDSDREATPVRDQQDDTTRPTDTASSLLRDSILRRVPIVHLSRPHFLTTQRPGNAPERWHSVPPQDGVTSSFSATSEQLQEAVELNLIPAKERGQGQTSSDHDNELRDSLSDRTGVLARQPATSSTIHALSRTLASAAVTETTDKRNESNVLPPNQQHREVIPADAPDKAYLKITTTQEGILYVVKKNEVQDKTRKPQVSRGTAEEQASTSVIKSESRNRLPEATSTSVPQEVTGFYTTGTPLASLDVPTGSRFAEGIKRSKKSGSVTDKEYATTHAVFLETTPTDRSEEVAPSKGGTVYKGPFTDVTTVKSVKAEDALTENPTYLQSTETGARITSPKNVTDFPKPETVSSLLSWATVGATLPSSDITTSEELPVQTTDKGDDDFEVHPPEVKEVIRTTVFHETAPPLESHIDGLPVFPTAPLEPREELDTVATPRQEKPEAEGPSITESHKEVDSMTTEKSDSTGAEKGSVKPTTTMMSTPIVTDVSSKRTSEAGSTTTPQESAKIGVSSEDVDASPSPTRGEPSESARTVDCLLLETGCGSASIDRTPPKSDGATFSLAEPHRGSPSPDVSFCITVTLGDTWDRFCREVEQFRHSVAAVLSSELRPTVDPHQVVIEDRCGQGGLHRDNETVVVRMHLTDASKRYSKKLTALAAVILHHDDRQHMNMQMMNVCFYGRQPTLLTTRPLEGMSSTGVIASITISAVAGTSLFLICILLVVMRERLHSKRGTPATADALSLASFKSSFRKKKIRQSLRSFLNEAFDDNEELSKPVPFGGLPAAVSNKDALEEEFKRIPMNMPRVDDVPQGVERKNRYANVIPIPETRVLLSSRPDDDTSDYINANFVRGYKGRPQRYIACQAPLPETIEDFWRMIWEQQCKAILMLTACEENGVQRCASYFPHNTLDCHKLYGDYQVTLVSKDVRPSFTVSTFKLHHLDKNLCREVFHCWYTAWPPQGVPEDVSSVVLFLLEARQYTSRSSSPIVVHCSPGTGRTGTILAIDVCMQELEDKRRVDVPRTVLRLRHDRGGAVQTKDQYAFIYEALYDYSARLAAQSQRPSVVSAT